jgi:Uma2 family endonuclease
MLGYNLSMATAPQYDVLHEMTLTGLPLPITVRPPVAITDDDLLELSRRNETLHIERNAKGELEIMSPAGGRGSRLESRVIRELDFWTEEHGGASFGSSGGFHLPDGSVLSPDAAWISAERWDALTDREQTKYPPLCPEFVIEVLSESDSRRVLEAKMELWMENGALLAWLIDPYAATVSVYRPGRKVEELSRPDFVEAGEPLAGFRLKLAAMWQR